MCRALAMCTSGETRHVQKQYRLYSMVSCIPCCLPPFPPFGCGGGEGGGNGRLTGHRHTVRTEEGVERTRPSSASAQAAALRCTHVGAVMRRLSRPPPIPA